MSDPRPGLGYGRDAWRRLRSHRLALAGLATVSLVALAAALGPLLSPYTPDHQDLSATLRPPSLSHPFGTDDLGRDVLTRVLCGARISLAVGLAAAVVALGVGVPYGAVAGYLGGRVDELMMRLVDVLYGLPFLLYVILILVVLGPGLQNVLLALGTVCWLDVARVVRGEVRSLREREFVLAARSLGLGPARILRRHLIPNAAGPIIVTVTLVIPQAIFAEAFLAFIGLGVSAPMASWGSLAADGYASIRVAPWQLLFPGAAISLTMLGFHSLGDGLRDVLDPRSRRG